MRIISVYIVCLMLLSICFFSASSYSTEIDTPPSPPEQPETGPGGKEYIHADVMVKRYGFGAQQFWIFEPADPTPVSAPVIVFNHGWSAIFPFFYHSWIHHIVKRGNILIYPRYQRGLYFGFQQFSDNAITAVKKALQELSSGNHVTPELEHFAIVGHSLGGAITVNMAALAELEGLPVPKAIMPVQPVSPSSNLSLISNTTVMLVIIGEDDTVVGDEGGRRIFYGADQIPLNQKDFVIQITDTYGDPDLLADHLAPLTPHILLGVIGKADAMDFYSTWKLFDALTDFAFYGIHGEYCLGNTSEQRFMGLWSDGTPVKELIITDSP